MNLTAASITGEVTKTIRQKRWLKPLLLFLGLSCTMVVEGRLMAQSSQQVFVSGLVTDQMGDNLDDDIVILLRSGKGDSIKVVSHRGLFTTSLRGTAWTQDSIEVVIRRQFFDDSYGSRIYGACATKCAPSDAQNLRIQVAYFFSSAMEEDESVEKKFRPLPPAHPPLIRPEVGHPGTAD